MLPSLGKKKKKAPIVRLPVAPKPTLPPPPPPPSAEEIAEKERLAAEQRRLEEEAEERAKAAERDAALAVASLSAPVVDKDADDGNGDDNNENSEGENAAGEDEADQDQEEESASRNAGDSDGDESSRAPPRLMKDLLKFTTGLPMKSTLARREARKEARAKERRLQRSRKRRQGARSSDDSQEGNNKRSRAGAHDDSDGESENTQPPNPAEPPSQPGGDIGAGPSSSSAAAPQLKFVDGKAVIDDQSITVTAGAEPSNLGEGHNDAPHESTGHVTSATYAKRSAPEKWTPMDTAKFYGCVLRFGTDFSMYSTVLVGRTRRQIKNKWRRENLLNPERIDKALKDSVTHGSAVLGALNPASSSSAGASSSSSSSSSASASASASSSSSSSSSSAAKQ